MEVVNKEKIAGKIVLLRMDIDVPISDSRVSEEFRLQAGLPTLNLCLENAQKIIVLGHLGRPEGKKVPELSVAPIYKWLEENINHQFLDQEKLWLLENLRFEKGEMEETAGSKENMEKYAHELAEFAAGENYATEAVFINEAFAAHHPAASTTVLPHLLPSMAGLRFAQEVEKLKSVRENPLHPFVAVIGGVKVEDKLPAVLALSKIAQAVLVGGKIAQELKKEEQIPANVLPGKLNEAETDMAPETMESWVPLIAGAKMVVWNGPIGAYEDPQNEQTQKLAEMILKSQAEVVIGGGDTVAALNKWGLLEKIIKEEEKRIFVSTGGGAMLKFLTEGTLPTVEALE